MSEMRNHTMFLRILHGSLTPGSEWNDISFPVVQKLDSIVCISFFPLFYFFYSHYIPIPSLLLLKPLLIPPQLHSPFLLREKRSLQFVYLEAWTFIFFCMISWNGKCPSHIGSILCNHPPAVFVIKSRTQDLLLKSTGPIWYSILWKWIQRLHKNVLQNPGALTSFPKTP